MDGQQPMQDDIVVNTDSLKGLVIYLSGLKDGKGNLLPLGAVVLDDLWDAIKCLEGRSGYVCPCGGKTRSENKIQDSVLDKFHGGVKIDTRHT